jgi:hypothetical protein
MVRPRNRPHENALEDTMGRRATLALATLLCTTAMPAAAQTPVDGRIVRVVYEIVFDGGASRGSTWGFHLAHMRDGRYCVRLGNPGRLTLAIIEKVGDICFDGIPGTIERTGDRTTRAFDTKNKPITLRTYQKGTIERAGDDITLTITTCSRPEGEADYRCFPSHYVVHMNGPDCSAVVTLSGSKSRAGTTTCEHYEAR